MATSSEIQKVTALAIQNVVKGLAKKAESESIKARNKGSHASALAHQNHADAFWLVHQYIIDDWTQTNWDLLDASVNLYKLTEEN